MSSTAEDAPKRLSSLEASSLKTFSAELELIMPVVTRVARRFAPFGDAEDLIQEACLAGWRYRHRFDPEKGSFQTWLLRILLNESYKTAGRRRRNRLLLGRVAEVLGISSGTAEQEGRRSRTTRSLPAAAEAARQ